MHCKQTDEPYVFDLYLTCTHLDAPHVAHLLQQALPSLVGGTRVRLVCHLALRTLGEAAGGAVDCGVEGLLC